MSVASPLRAPIKPERGSLRSVIWAEWVKFRTVRGWVIGGLVAASLCVAFTFLVANGNNEGSCTPNGVCTPGHPFVPTGPGGEAIADSYQFVAQALTGNGTLTARITALTGLIWNGPGNQAPSLAHTRPELEPWAKAGILVISSTNQGSPYAAIMATGDHGVRFQYNYTHDQADQPRTITTSWPRWLRLTRTGNTLIGYDSNNGRTWTQIGTTHLAGLAATVQVGLFATSPVSFLGSSSGAATQATATFDQVTVNGRAAQDGWQARGVGTSAQDYYPILGADSYHRSDSTFVLSGSGDIALAVNPLAGGDTASASLWFGLLVALFVLIVVATMFVTVEYRRGLIRTTFTATPQRGAVLAAKAVVIGAVALTVGAVAAAVGSPLGDHILNANGNYIFPASALTKVQIVAGSGALLAVSAVAVLALGTILRTSAATITTAIVLFVLPYIVSTYSAGAVGTWLFRLTPAAGFSVLGVLPRSGLVDAPYTMSNDYYPLAPWAGLAVLCAYTAITVCIAALLLRRRDA